MVQKNRILSIDLFRGITIGAMILVNNPGDWGAIYSPLKHAKWHGCTLADLIFPFFLFIMGVSIPISFQNRKENSQSKFKLFLKITKRSALLFLLGIILNGFPEYNLDTIRIPGVLQRIGIVYFFTAIIFIQFEFFEIFLITVLILCTYGFIELGIPSPDLNRATLEAGKDITALIDRIFLNGHLWIYTKTWDPEGILSTYPAIATGLSGILLGMYFLRFKESENKDSFYGTAILIGFLLLVSSVIINVFYPINKNLWTSTYVLMTSGLAIISFCILERTNEENKESVWMNPFLVFGTNALALYFGSGILSRLLNIPFIENAAGKKIGLKIYLYGNYFTPYFGKLNASLLWGVFYLFLWWLLLLVLYRKKIFIKL